MKIYDNKKGEHVNMIHFLGPHDGVDFKIYEPCSPIEEEMEIVCDSVEELENGMIIMSGRFVCKENEKNENKSNV